MKSLLIAVAAFGLAGPLSTTAQISVTASGVGPLDFGTLPPVTEWSTTSVAGAAGDSTVDVTLDLAVIANTTAASVNAVLTTSATQPPSQSGAARYNTAGFYLQTRPTGVNYLILMATLRNDAGADVTSMTVSYDWDQKNNNPVNEQIPGHRAYYSLTGLAGSWTLIPEFSTFTTSSTAQNLSKTFAFAPGWGSGTTMYIIWVDDNGAGSTADPMEGSYTLDNFAITSVVAGVPQPPAITTQPVGTNVNEGQVASLHVAATGANLMYQWYYSPTMVGAGTSIPNATSSSYSVTNRLGGSRYPWSNPMDAGFYYVTITGTVPPAVESDHVAVAVAADVTAPTLSYAICGPGANEVTLTFSEPMNNETGDVADQFLWEFRTLDDSESIQLAGNGVYTDDGRSRNIVFTFDAPGRDPAKSYKLVRASDPGSAVAVDTAKAPNGLARGASIPILCFTNEIFGYTKTWQYNDDDVDPGATWANVGYDDSAAPWATGAAPFDGKLSGSGAAPFQGDANNCRPWTYYDLGNSNVNTCINYRSPVTLTNLHTAYFRTHFSFSGSPAGKYLLAHGKLDDAGVIYLNGTEVGRMRVADAALPHDQYSGGATVGDGDAQDVFSVINSTALVSGDNVLAVLLKQGNSTSSDLTMGLALAVLEATPAAVRPVLTISYSADHPTISWTPTGGTLQFKHNLSDATWTDIGAATTPYTDLASPGDHGFYQVKTP